MKELFLRKSNRFALPILLAFLGAVGNLYAGACVNCTTANYPFPQNRGFNNGIRATNYDNADILAAYNVWYTDCVTSSGAGGYLRVQRPNDSGLSILSSVSEGIAYGMLISVYMNDQALFDALWKYEQIHLGGNGLMNWYILQDGSNGPNGSGAATDADEDMAWALVMAHYQWGGAGSLSGTYLNHATTVIGKIYNTEIVSSDGTVKPGDAWGASGGPHNVSYYDPAAYRVFGTVTGNTTGWNTAVDRCYTLLNLSLNATNGNATNGLVPSWCDSSGLPVNPGFTTRLNYQYDSCRTPFRIVKDYLFNGESRAATYCQKTSSFFSAIGASAIQDGYYTNGTAYPELPTLRSFQNPGFQSAAFVGPAGCGGMVSSSYQSLVNAAYEGIRSVDKLVGGTYYDESWTVLSMLLMSGTFLDYTKTTPVPTPTGTIPTPTRSPTPGPTRTFTCSPTITSTPTVTATLDPCFFVKRINCGGPQVTDGNGNVWSADQAYTTGGWGYVAGTAVTVTNDIGGTTDDALYQTERYNAPLEYDITVPNGTYAVLLKFTERYFTTSGQRVFSVVAEGVTVIQNLDIFASAGGQFVAYDKSVSVTVTDGVLTLSGIASVNNALFNAIEVIATTCGSVTPTPTRSWTKTPTVTATFTPTPTASFTKTATWTPTSTPTASTTATSSPSRTSSITPTSSPTLTPTASNTATSTWTPTSTGTATPSLTRTASPIPTSTPTASTTATSSPSRTSSRTPTPSPTLTPTASYTATPTMTLSSTRTATSTWTPPFTATMTLSPTGTSSSTPTPTGTATRTRTLTQSPTFTATLTPSLTRTNTATGTATLTMTPSSTRTATSTWTPLSTSTRTFSPTETFTVTFTSTSSTTATMSSTRTSSSTPTVSWTATPTMTLSSTRTATSTWTPPSTSTMTVTPTATFSFTGTSSSTPSSTATRTSTPTETFTVTLTPTASATATFSPSWTSSSSPTASWTATETRTESPTATSSATFSPTLTTTLTSTDTLPPTRTFTHTRTPTQTRTLTFTSTATLALTSTWTFTRTPTATPSASTTSTPSLSLTPSRTSSSTPSASSTPTSTQTVTATRTVTPSFTPTVSMTPTASWTATPSPSWTPSSSPTASWTATETRTESPAWTVTPEAPALSEIETPIAFPNPVGFGETVTVKIALGVFTENVKLQVFTTAYRKILEKDLGPMQAGTGKQNWGTLELRDEKGSRLANGVYYIVCRTANGASATGKLLVLK